MVHATTLFFCLVFLAGPNYVTSAADMATVNPATPPYGHFNVSDGGKVCLLINLQCEIFVDQLNTTETVQYTVPADAHSSGYCSQGAVSKIDLTWADRNKVILVLSMEFVKSSEEWSTSKVAFNATTSSGQLVTNGTSESNGKDQLPMKAKAGNSYKCMEKQEVQLGNTVNVSFLEIQVQPFGGKFGNADVCSANDKEKDAAAVKDTIVPIAVGCALLGMVFILIITYIVGRVQRSGYEKM